MDEQSLAVRMDALERRPAPKDLWDKLDVLAKVLVPLTVVAAGFFFSCALDHAQISSAERLKERDISAAADLKERDIAVAVVNSRVQQASLINLFMEALVSGSTPRRQLAITAIMIALPQDGPELVRVVSASEKDGGISKFADDALAQRRGYLIHRLFADSADVRIPASLSLVQGWRSHPELVPVLLDTARQHLDNKNGVFNTLGILVQMDPTALRLHLTDIETFATAAVVGIDRDSIRSIANKVRQRART